jgi:subfamily B ATP-binding cassette protein MsbA
MFQYFASVCVSYQIANFSKGLKELIFSRYLSFGKLFFDRNNMGYLQNVLLDFTNSLTSHLKGIEVMLSWFFMLIVYLWMMFSISWKITAFVIIIFPLLNSVLRIIIAKIKRGSSYYARSYGELSKSISNILSCIPLVKLYTNERKEKEDFSILNERLKSIQFSIDKKQNLVAPLQESMLLVAVLLLISFMTFVIQKEKTGEIGTFLVYFYILKRSQTAFNALNNVRTSLAYANGPISAISEILDDKDKFFVEDGGKEFSELKEGIDFRHLSFSYIKGKEVLRDVTLKIDKGKFLALVGPSGGGKTTLINLILRFYDCPPNSILIDGNDIRSFTLKSLRSRIAVVSQDAWLFNDTIRNNIVYGLKKDIPAEQVARAAKNARLLDFINSLPEGFDTYIGDRGVKLSGGEKQRLSIARALLKGADILILDEATSSLDTKTERLIQESINEMIEHKTVIAIAHRLSTIQHADRIIVIDNGKTLEEGTLNELLASRGLFYEYWKDQKFFLK